MNLTTVMPKGAAIRRTGLVALLMVPVLNFSAGAADGVSDSAPSRHHEAIATLFRSYESWERSAWGTAPGDYRPATIRNNLATVDDLQSRLEGIDSNGLAPHDLVDYLTVRALLDRQEFILRVTRPWARDPVFYLNLLQPIAFTAVSDDAAANAALRSQLEAIPEFLSQARISLTAMAADYADLALYSLSNSDGVEAGYPPRDVPPPGVIGWYEDLASRTADRPALASAVAAALGALREYQAWLQTLRPSLEADAGVGRAAFDWFLHNALLMPYDSGQMEVLAQRELERLWAFYALERHKNRDLEEITLAKSQAEYQGRLAATDALVRGWIDRESFISVPDYVPRDWQEMGYNVPFVERESPNYWEQIQYRDPSPDHLHAVIPGHRFDALVSSHIDHPIRSTVNFGARWQGWAVYLEEAPLQLGVLAERPRARELIYLFGVWRAARALGDIYNQWNTMDAAEAAAYWLKVTPLLEPNVARKYAYLRPSPGHGVEYTLGNLEMFALLAARKQQLGDAFELGVFHDEFLSYGRIPMALISYEMTGDGKHVAPFLKRQPLAAFLQQHAALR